MSDTSVLNERVTTGALLADATRLGPVQLTINNLERSTAFYQEVIGLDVLRCEAQTATLGTGAEELVVLHEQPQARRPGRTAGIYHFALLFPTREELARAGMRVLAARAPIDGASDHGTHEAIYLPDPDGIGIELAADRPREQWPDYERSEFATGGPKPLDIGNLLRTVPGEQASGRAAAGLRMGHIHLHVGDLDAATRFYRDGVGFEVMATLPSAVFVSFARYHHHLAYNVWHGRGAPPAPDEAVGLEHWTLQLAGPDELSAARERLEALGASIEERPDGLLARDPSRVAVLLRGAL
jgi:catechol 2,3-dioxygenase